MTHLYLVRHAEAVCNVRHVMGGPVGDGGLTALGVRQAERLRDRLAAGEVRADVLLSSPLPRAQQTAAIIAPALGLTPILDPDLEEQRIGEADGLNLDEIRERFGQPDQRGQPFRRVAPGAELWSELMLRVAGALHRLTEAYAGKTILLVTHGGVIDGSFVTFFGLPSLAAPPFLFATHNTSLTHWMLHRSFDGVHRWRLERYNDVVHLRDLGTPDAIPWDDVAAVPAVGADQPSGPPPSSSG